MRNNFMAHSRKISKYFANRKCHFNRIKETRVFGSPAKQKRFDEQMLQYFTPMAARKLT